MTKRSRGPLRASGAAKGNEGGRAVTYRIGGSTLRREEGWAPFRLRLGRARGPATNFRVEALRAARALRARTDRPIAVCYSGGLDSELVVEAFRAAGIPVLCAILRYEDGLNQHDIRHALAYCRRTGQEYRVLRLRVRNFLRGPEYAQACRRIRNPFPIAPANFFLFTRLASQGYFPVAGCGEPSFTLRRDRLFLEDGEINFALEQFCAQQNLEAEPSFFRSRAELYLATLRWFARRAKGLEVPGNLCLNIPYKQALYTEAFGLAPRRKFHGYERLLEREPEFARYLIRRRHPTHKIARIPLGQAIRRMEA